MNEPYISIFVVFSSSQLCEPIVTILKMADDRPASCVRDTQSLQPLLSLEHLTILIFSTVR